MLLDGRVAIVTGSGNGLGRSHARYLASHGAKIVLNDLSEQALAKVQQDIAEAGGTAIVTPGSVTDEVAAAAMLEAAVREWGRVDILINNAGILRDKSFAKMSIDDFRAVMDVQLMGSVICTKAVWEVMRDQNYGRIVMTTSSSGLFGNFGQANYGAAKMALVGLMQTLGIEGAKYNIRVNCLAPTAATQMTQGILSDESLEMLAPERVSPALLPLVVDDAPNRAILCAGAGHFSRSNITLTDGVYVGSGKDAGEQVIAKWEAISDRTAETVPDYGFKQAENEVSNASAAAA